MSCSYADGLSPYHDKGKLGLAEQFDDTEDVQKKVRTLANWINQSKHVVIHTGAGISTSAGIPDFRGPKGVWTLEERGEKPTINISFNEAIPTKTHMAILKLVQANKIQFVISQNIDGLHLRSGIPRTNFAELHGNMFIEQCNRCQRQFVRDSATTSVGQKCLEKQCPSSKSNGRACRGKLHDTILDWEHDLPEKDLGLADFHSCMADLSICLGTTLQIVPSGTLPLSTKKYNSGKLVICNLQPTKHDKKADLLIHTYVDDIMVQLMQELGLDLPHFDPLADPSRLSKQMLVEWTIPDSEVKRTRVLYELICCKSKKKRKIEEESSGGELPTKIKPSVNVKESNPKMSKTSVNEIAIGGIIKQEPRDDHRTLVTTEIRNSNQMEKCEPINNMSDELIGGQSDEKVNFIPSNDHRKNNSLSCDQVFREQGVLKNSTENDEIPFDTNRNTSSCLIKEEVISC